MAPRGGFEDIACEKNMHRALNAGSVSHRLEVWEAARTSRIFNQKGPKVKLGRWCSFLNANRFFRGEEYALLLILVYMGVLRGWWRDADEIPTLSHRLALLDDGQACEGDRADIAIDDAEVEAGAPLEPRLVQPSAASSSGAASSSSVALAAPLQPAAASSSSSSASTAARPQARAAISSMACKRRGDDPRGIKESNECLKAVRSNTRGTLHFGAMVLASHYGNRIGELIDSGSRHFSGYFDLGRTTCNTISGALNYHMDLADCGMNKVAKGAFMEFEDPVALDRMAFAQPGEWDDLTGGAKAEEELLATALFDLAVAVAENYLLSSMSYSKCYPGKFFLLADEADEGRMATAMAAIKQDYEVLEKLENMAARDQYVQDFVGQLRWPGEQWCREMFVILSELDWGTDLSREAQARLSGFAHSRHGTNIDEGLVNKCRFKESAHTASQLFPTAMRHAASSSRLVKESGRAEITNTPAAKCQRPAPITDAAFYGKAMACSLGAEDIAAFGRPGAFPRLSLAALKLRGVAFDSAAALKGDLADIKHLWLSQMISPGKFVHNPHMLEGRKGPIVRTRAGTIQSSDGTRHEQNLE